MQHLTTTLTIAILSVACSSADPVYVQPDTGLEAGGAEEDPDNPPTAQLLLPLRLETDAEAAARAELATELGIDVPYIKLGDMELSLEWSIRNLSDNRASARILLNGANEYFAYVPAGFVIDPEEEPEPPPLTGNIPIAIPAQSTVHGVFREDELLEAAIDLELITRGERDPFATVLATHENTGEFTGPAGTIPRAAFAHLVRFDITLLANANVVLEYAVRVRSNRVPNLFHDKGLNAIAGELSVFTPTDFVPVFAEEN